MHSIEYYDLLEKRKKLPANNLKVIQSFYDGLSKFDLMLISSSTGSGKSTQIPLHIFSYYGMIENEFLPKKKSDNTDTKLIKKSIKKKGGNTDIKIIMSQPRRINTKTIAEFISKQLDTELGKEVGYKYRYEDKSSENTKLLMVTDGLLVQYLYKNMESYNVVIIDEIHTRTPYVDISLYLIKKYLSESKSKNKTKFILMSATMNIGNLEKYFADINMGILDIEGRSFPVKNIYLDEHIDNKNMVLLGDKMLEIIMEKKKIQSTADILIFLSGKKQISYMKNKIMESFPEEFLVLELYSGISKELELLATSMDEWKNMKSSDIQKLTGQTITKKTKRKIILSTNVGETGVTIDGVNIVIDSGIELNSKFDNSKRTKILNTEYISKASASQRCGRAGRTSPGECIRLYKDSDLQLEYPIPPILVDDLYSVFIDLLKISNNNPEEVRNVLRGLIDPVPIENIDNTYNFIDKMGLINSNLGNVVQQLQIQPEYALTLLSSKKYAENYPTVLFIVACLINKDRFDEFLVQDDNKKKKILDKYANKKGGIFAFKKLYDALEKNKILRNNYYDAKHLEKFCKSNKIKFGTLSDSLKGMFKLDAAMKTLSEDSFDIKISQEDFSSDPILAAFKHGFKLNEITKNMNGKRVAKKYFIESSDNLLKSEPKYYVGITIVEGIVKLNTGFPEI